jgi:hypothetical protein
VRDDAAVEEDAARLGRVAAVDRGDGGPGDVGPRAERGQEAGPRGRPRDGAPRPVEAEGDAPAGVRLEPAEGDDGVQEGEARHDLVGPRGGLEGGGRGAGGRGVSRHEAPDALEERRERLPRAAARATRDLGSRPRVLDRHLPGPGLGLGLDPELPLEEASHGQRSAPGRRGEHDDPLAPGELRHPEDALDPVAPRSAGQAQGDAAEPVRPLQALLHAEGHPGVDALLVRRDGDRLHLSPDHDRGGADEGLGVHAGDERRAGGRGEDERREGEARKGEGSRHGAPPGSNGPGSGAPCYAFPRRRASALPGTPGTGGAGVRGREGYGSARGSRERSERRVRGSSPRTGQIDPRLRAGRDSTQASRSRCSASRCSGVSGVSWRSSGSG